MELSTAGRKKINRDGLTVARAYRPIRSLLPEKVDELPIKPNHV